MDTDDYEVSATIPDWQREKAERFWDPGRKLLASIRMYQKLRGRKSPIARLRCKAQVLRHRFWSAVSGADIPINCVIGGGLLIPHPNGIVVNPGVEIGVNCLISQQVTLGTKRGGGIPQIGGHVDIGAGAKILGQVIIHEHAQIGANAVVTHDVPSHAVVAGIPARVIRPGDGCPVIDAPGIRQQPR